MLLPWLGVLRKALAVQVAILLCFFATPGSQADDLKLPQESPHLLMDMKTNLILSGHRIDQRWAPASLTKLMTAYTVFRALELQHLKMNSPVRISETALAQPPSKMGFPIGTILTVEAAVKIIMVKSANDVSVAIAESVGGSEAQFIELMNSHARRLGLSDTQFVNPHGLHDPAQYTSARDMAILAHAITEEFPQYADFFDIPAIRIGKRRLRNHNALLRLFEGTRGMKTGYVCASGYNVIVRTRRADRDLLVVVFGGRSGLARNVKAAQLLSDGFGGKFGDGEAGRLHSKRIVQSGGEPEDITRITCPRKYAALAKPEVRPPEAPVTQDFDGIDTQILIDRKKRDETILDRVAVPKERPEYSPPKPIVVVEPSVGGEPADSSAAKKEAAIAEDKPPSLKELAAIYLQPVAKLKPEQPINLAGATGPNPFGIKHTNGGVYVPPIPVPVSRPVLDLARTEE